jgi:hypothetical protein
MTNSFLMIDESEGFKMMEVAFIVLLSILGIFCIITDRTEEDLSMIDAYTTGYYYVGNKDGTVVYEINGNSKIRVGLGRYQSKVYVSKVSGDIGYTNRIMCTYKYRQGWINLNDCIKVS